MKLSQPPRNSQLPRKAPTPSSMLKSLFTRAAPPRRAARAQQESAGPRVAAPPSPPAVIGSDVSVPLPAGSALAITRLEPDAAGLELLRVKLTFEQERELSPARRQALVAARVARARRSAELCVSGQAPAHESGARERATVMSDAMREQAAVPIPFKLDLGRELIEFRPSDGRAGPPPPPPLAPPPPPPPALLTGRARDSLVAARVKRARNYKHAVRPQATQRTAVKPLRLSGVGPTLQRSETLSSRLNPDRTPRDSHGHLADGADREAAVWRELGVALASARLTFADEAKLSARGREALGEARAAAARGVPTDTGAAAAGWLDFAMELESVGMSETDEKELSNFARDALAAARSTRASQAGTAWSKPSRPWVDFALELDAVGLSEGDEQSLSSQGRDALVAARVIRARGPLSNASAVSTPRGQWLQAGVELDAVGLDEHDELSLSGFAQDSLVVVRALRARGALVLREGGEAQLSKPRREWIDFGLQLDAAGLNEEEEAGLGCFARDAIAAARALRAHGALGLEEDDEGGLSDSKRAWIEFGCELDAEGLTEDEEQALGDFARGALAAARALRARVDSGLAERGEAYRSTANRRWVNFGHDLNAAALDESEQQALSTFARDAMAAARLLRARERPEEALSKASRAWIDFGRELDSAGLSEGEEQALSGQGRDALIAARAVRAREMDEAALSKHGHKRGFEPYAPRVGEGGEVAPSNAARPWIGFGLELDSAGLSEAQERTLSGQGRDALVAARAMRAREMDEAAPSKRGRKQGPTHGAPSVSEGKEAALSKTNRPWIAFGMELDSAGLSEAEERALSGQGRDALIAARALRAREMGEASLSKPGRKQGSSTPDAPSVAEGGEAVPSKADRPWIAFGLDLDSAGLSEAEERALSGQGRDALIAARAVRAREMGEAALSKPSRKQSLSTPAMLSVAEGGETVPSRANRPWLAFGLKLDSAGLSEAEERALSGPGRDALIAARAVRAREMDEAAPSKRGRNQGSTHGAPSVGGGEEAALSKANRPWIAFGLELDSAGLLEAEEWALSGKGRDALVAARAVRAREMDEAAPSKPGRMKGLAHGAPSAGERGEAVPSKANRPWIAFGLELDSAGLSEAEERALSDQGHDALIAARAVRAREMDEAALSKSGRRQQSLLPDATSVGLAGEAVSNKANRPLIAAELGLDSPGLSEAQERALSGQGRDVSVAARAVRARDMDEAAFSKPNRKQGPSKPYAPTVAQREEAVPSKANCPWIAFGLELDSAGLSEAEERALSGKGRDALVAARAVRAREMAEASLSKPCRKQGSASPDAPCVAEGGEAVPSKANRPWIAFGLELDSAGLSEAEERALSGQGRDTLIAARAVRAREMDEAALSKPSRTQGSATPDAPNVAEGGVAVSSKPNRPWIAFGLELDSAGLSEAEERALSGQGRDALVAARAVRVREIDEATLSKPGRTQGFTPAAQSVGKEEEAVPSKANRPRIDLGLELDALGLSEAEERALNGPIRDDARDEARRPTLPLDGVPCLARSPKQFTDFWTLNSPRTPRRSVVMQQADTVCAARTSVNGRTTPVWRGPPPSPEKALPGPSGPTPTADLAATRAVLPIRGFQPTVDHELTFVERVLTLGGMLQPWTARPALDAPAAPGGVGTSSRGSPSHDGDLYNTSRHLFPLGPTSVGEEHAPNALMGGVATLSDQSSSGAPTTRAVRPFGPSLANAPHEVRGLYASPLAANPGDLRTIGDQQSTLPTPAPDISDLERRGGNQVPHVASVTPTGPATIALGGEQHLDTVPGGDTESDPTALGVQQRTDCLPVYYVRGAKDPVPATAASYSSIAPRSTLTGDDAPYAARESPNVGLVHTTHSAAPAGFNDDNLGTFQNVPSVLTVASRGANGLPNASDNVTLSALGNGLVERGNTPDAPHVRMRVAEDPVQPHTVGPTPKQVDAISLELRQQLETVPTSYAHVAETALRYGSTTTGDRHAQPAFDASERMTLVKHLNWALRGDVDVERLLPIDPSGDDVFACTSTGILLGKFVAYVDVSALDARALNLEHGGQLRQDQMLQNQTLVMNAATSIGCGVAGLSAQGLVAASDDTQQGCLHLAWNLTRSGLLNPISVDKNPALLGLLLPGEDPAAGLAKYRPEQVIYTS